VFSYLTLPELAAASAVCSAGRAIPLRADHALWRAVAASGSVTPQLRGALWSAVLCSAGGGGGASGYEAAGGGASLHEALALGPTPTALPRPSWPRGLMDALVARLANVAAGKAGGGEDGGGAAGGSGGGGGGGSSSLLLALTPLRPRTVAKLLCPWVGDAWGGAERGFVGGGGGEAPPLSLPLSFLAGEHGRPGAKGGHALTLSVLPQPLVLRLGPEDVEEAAEDGAPPPPPPRGAPPPSAAHFRRYCTAAAANEAAAAAVRGAREAAAALCAARAENRRLERILSSAADNNEALPAELSELIARAAEALASAEFAQRRTEVEARAAIRAAHAEVDGADRALVKAVLTARTSLVVRLVQAWAAANVRFHKGGDGEPAAAAAAALTSPVDGKVVPSQGVALPPPHRGGEALGARALCGGGAANDRERGGGGAPQLLWLSPSKPAPAALAGSSALPVFSALATSSFCGGEEGGGEAGRGNAASPAPQRDAPPPSLPALASISSPASLADAIDSILSAGPPEAALDLSPLLPLPPRLEAAVLAAAAEDGSAEEERQLGLGGVPFPTAVWGHPVHSEVESGSCHADEKMGPFTLDLWPPSCAEEAAALPPAQRVCALPALPFLPQGDFIARDVSRTFGELESAVRSGDAAGTPPRAADLLPTALLEGGGDGALTAVVVARLRRRLQRVLSANTAYDRGASSAPVIYTQGANYVVAFLLRHIGASASFWAFSSLCHSPAYALRDVYGAGLWRVKCAFSTLEALAGERLPKLCSRLRARDIAPTSFATGWVMTLFSSFDALPPSVVAGGVWDPFLLRGWKALMASMLTVLEGVSPDISRMTELEQIVTLLHNIPEGCLPDSGGALAVHCRRWALSYKELSARARHFDATAYPERYEWARRVARVRRLAARAALGGGADPTRVTAAIRADTAVSEYDVVGSRAAGEMLGVEDVGEDGVEGSGGGPHEKKPGFGWSGIGRRGQGLLRMMKPMMTGGLWGGASAASLPLDETPLPATDEAAGSVPNHPVGFAAALSATLGAAFGIAPPAALPAAPHAAPGSRAPSRRQTEGSEVLDGGPPSHTSSPRGPQPVSPTPDAPVSTALNTSVPTVNFAQFIVASSAPPSPAGAAAAPEGSPVPPLSISVPAAMPTPFFSGLLALPPGSPSSPSPAAEGSPPAEALALRPPAFLSPEAPAQEAPVPSTPGDHQPGGGGGGGGGGSGGGGSGERTVDDEGGGALPHDEASPVRGGAPGTIAWPSPRDAPAAPAPPAAAGGGGGVLAGLRKLSVNLSGLVKEGSFLRPRGPSTDET
jgi:hypothetical protein